MKMVLIAIVVVGAFLSGAFVSSPELRAYAANTIGSADIIDESILSKDIKNGEIKTADIASGAVQNSDLGNDSVTALKIKNLSVTNADLALSSVTSSVIADGAVLASDIATNAVASEEISDGSIVRSDVSPSFMKFKMLGLGGDENGWTPNGTLKGFFIYDSDADNFAVTTLSVENSGNPSICGVYHVNGGVGFFVYCTAPPSDNARLSYVIMGP